MINKVTPVLPIQAIRKYNQHLQKENTMQEMDYKLTIKGLEEQVEMLTYERDFYRQKFESTQIKNFLQHFTPQEQMELFEMIDKGSE